MSGVSRSAHMRNLSVFKISRQRSVVGTAQSTAVYSVCTVIAASARGILLS